MSVKYLDLAGLTKYSEKVKELLNNKVEKIEGKQLSTEDFTADLKAKLEGLTNYDDKTLTTEINGLKSRLNTILDSDNTTTVIDTFQEIESFLQGITTQETLTGLLQDLKEDIITLCADNYLQLKPHNLNYDDDLNNYTSNGLWGTNNISQLILSLINKPDNLLHGECYLRVININGYGQLILWHKPSTKPGITYVRTFNKNNEFSEWELILTSIGRAIITNSNVLPFIINNSNTDDPRVYMRLSVDDNEKADIGYGPTYGVYIYNKESNKYLGIKDDGTPHYQNSTLLHAGNFSSYTLPLSGGTISNYSENPLCINSEKTDVSHPESGIIYKLGNETKGWIGYDSKYGVMLSNHQSNSRLALTDDGILKYHHNNITYNVWHENNDGSDSGLDADLLDGKQPADLNVGSADSLKLVNNNTVAPTPNDVTGYKVKTFRYSDTHWRTSLVIGNANTTWHTWELSCTLSGMFQLRYGTESFGGWKNIAFLDSNVASADKLTTKQLTDEDLNDLNIGGSAYFGNSNNTCSNKPFDIESNGFTLYVNYRGGTSYVSQTIIDAYGKVYIRSHVNNIWTEWKKLLTEDDISTLSSKVSTLEEKITLLENKIAEL